mgnify:FL=1
MIAEIFEQNFQKPAEIFWQAPGRVNLIGEHTDYNQGFVLPMAIEKRTVVAIGRNERSIHRIYSANTEELIEHPAPIGNLEISGWARYPLGVLKLLEISDQGLDIAISSDVPIGGGLSSSAALECSVGAGVNKLLELDNEKLELAKICQRAENEVVGAPTGNMDQIASLFGKADNAVFIDCRSEEIQLVDLGFEKAGLEIVVIDTRTSHKLDDGDYGNRRDECYSAADKLGIHSLRDLNEQHLEGVQSQLTATEFKRARHIVTENQRVLKAVQAVREQEYFTFGKLMTESHSSMRDDFEISTAELDQAVEASLQSGALGARMTGGGFGGSGIALIESQNIPQLTDSVLEAFKQRGFKTPEIFAVKPSCGAREIKGTN